MSLPCCRGINGRQQEIIVVPEWNTCFQASLLLLSDYSALQAATSGVWLHRMSPQRHSHTLLACGVIDHGDHATIKYEFPKITIQRTLPSIAFLAILNL